MIPQGFGGLISDTVKLAEDLQGTPQIKKNEATRITSAIEKVRNERSLCQRSC